MPRLHFRHGILLESLLLSGLTLGGCSPSSPPPNPPPAKALIPETLALQGNAQYLPEHARAILKKRMGRHAARTHDLLIAVTTLNFLEAREHASALIEEPQLARPLDGDATMLNALLPEALFESQDALIAACRHIALSASHRNPRELATAFGDLAKACVQCHAAYLKLSPQGEIAPLGPE